MSTDAQLLDMDVVTVRTDGWRYDVLDNTNAKIGEVIAPVGAQIANDATAAIKRRLTNFELTSDVYADIDPLAHRIRPMMVLENGSEYPLGVFIFADAATNVHSWGDTLSATLVDQNLILGQQLRYTVSVAAGANVGTAISEVAAAAGVLSVSVDATSVTVGSPLVWPAGKSSATYGRVLSDLALLGGFHDPFFNNTGALIARRLVDPDTVTATITYADGGRIYAESIVETNDMLRAANLFVVVDTAPTWGPVSYALAVSADAPHSYVRRGWWLPRVIEAPGVGNEDNARAVANSAAAADPLAWETVVFAGPADPRHDTFDVIEFRGDNYLELGWSMALDVGAPMAHTVKRVLL